MDIYITTDKPQGLLDSIREKIENQTIQTWNEDSEGDFTHVSQWKEKAWFKPYVQQDQKSRLTFGLIGRKDETMTKRLYGIYHGRFSEMLLTHFDSMINSIELTTQGVEGIDSYR